MGAYLGIEIGGTKLQLGVGRGDGGPFLDYERRAIVPARGAEGIREQIIAAGKELFARQSIGAIGIGFGGPVDAASGTVLLSHQIEGWKDFPLADWCARQFGVPVALGNDCDCAALAEARFGAGRGSRVVFYVTVGSGIGGGLAIDGNLYAGGAHAVAEIGHLRPGPAATDCHDTVEAAASGWGIAAAARRVVSAPATACESPSRRRAIDDLLARAGHSPDRLSTEHVGAAAREGNPVALELLDSACRVLGWAIAQVVTLVAPNKVVVGGGVALLGEELFLQGVRRYAQQYVFPPLTGCYAIVPAALGEEMVVHGALALAEQARST